MHDKDEMYQYPQEEMLHGEGSENTDETVAAVDTAKTTGADTAEKEKPSLDKASGFISNLYKKAHFKRGTILLVLLIVVGVLGPKIYNKVSSGSDHLLVSANASVVDKDKKPTSQDVSALQAINKNTSFDKDVIKQSVHQMSSINTQINAMQANVNQLTKLQESNMRAQEKYQEMMLGLMEQIVKQQQAAAQLQNSKTVKSLSKTASKELISTIKKQMQKPMHYKVQGVVPGLAWLVDQNNNTTTVRVGDKIPGYGKVAVIDADKCVVITSSGKVIKQDA